MLNRLYMTTFTTVDIMLILVYIHHKLGLSLVGTWRPTVRAVARIRSLSDMPESGLYFSMSA